MRQSVKDGGRILSALLVVAALAVSTGVTFAWAARKAYHWTYVGGEAYILRISGWGADIFDCDRARRCAQETLGTSQVYCSQSGTYIEIPERGQGELHEVSCN
jgi:hypothetical protein